MEDRGPQADWRDWIEDVLTGMREWRTAHPQARFAEIEAAVDQRLDLLRARLLEEATLASRAAHLRGGAEAERPRCPDCGRALAERGQHERTLTVRGDRPVRLRRSYGVCPTCGVGHFPPR